MIFLLFSYNKHVYCVVHCIHVDYILCKHCVVMADTKKEKNLSESNFGHTEDEWGTEKKDSECISCDIKERKKNLDNKRIVAYKLNNEE